MEGGRYMGCTLVQNIESNTQTFQEEDKSKSHMTTTQSLMFPTGQVTLCGLLVGHTIILANYDQVICM